MGIIIQGWLPGVPRYERTPRASQTGIYNQSQQQFTLVAPAESPAPQSSESKERHAARLRWLAEQQKARTT